MDKEIIKREPEFLLYENADGDVKVEVFIQGETVWLTINKMAKLFATTKQNISLHLQNIFQEGELQRTATVKEILTVQKEGKRDVRRNLEYYNLDAIISVGYRVNSERAIQFRIWATKVLREYIIKGFAIDDNRLKNGLHFGKDYFDELLERIRDIRASERRFYQKITDIYAQCSIDYDSGAEVTKNFYATVQNKLHWAITGKTAAELISERADSSKPNMGLTTWKNSPKGEIRKSDITIAKNYMNEREIKELNRIVTMYLDYAEMQAERQNAMTMKDWMDKLDAFLKFNEHDILHNAGKVSAEVAKKLAEQEYEKYRKTRDQKIESDFDKFMKKYLKDKRDKE